MLICGFVSHREACRDPYIWLIGPVSIWVWYHWYNLYKIEHIIQNNPHQHFHKNSTLFPPFFLFFNLVFYFSQLFKSFFIKNYDPWLLFINAKRGTLKQNGKLCNYNDQAWVRKRVKKMHVSPFTAGMGETMGVEYCIIRYQMQVIFVFASSKKKDVEKLKF